MLHHTQKSGKMFYIQSCSEKVTQKMKNDWNLQEIFARILLDRMTFFC